MHEKKIITIRVSTVPLRDAIDVAYASRDIKMNQITTI